MDTRFKRGLAVLFALVVIIGAVAFWPIGDSRDDTTDKATDSDGDSLGDTFEREVAGTDPNDPDSDSTKTSRDERDNGVKDGDEQLGDAPLTLSIQQWISADPFTNDTDDDGLTDTFEVAELGLVHNVVNGSDTDDDGLPDGEEDPDNDTLTNLQEQDLGTDPLSNDTDEDGLTDDFEIEQDLDPLAADGDSDGLDDGAERRVGTDPAVSDTNGDGTTDGNQTHTVSMANESASTSLSITGEGDPTESLSISTNESAMFDNVSAAMSPAVDIDTNRSFSQASITISYDESLVPGDESVLAIYRFNESLQTWVELDSTVNTENNTVTANTTRSSEFSSIYAIFYKPYWNAHVDTPLPTRGNNSSNGSTESVDVQFIIDDSPSMSGDLPDAPANDPNGFRKIASRRFIDKLIEGDQASVILFDSTPDLKQRLTTNLTEAKSAANESLFAPSGTAINRALALGIDEFEWENEFNDTDSRTKNIVLLTDGENDVNGLSKEQMDSQTIEQAHRAADQNITIYVVGLGNADDELLREVADITGGEYHHVTDVEGLPTVVDRISDTTINGADLDDDGLPDMVEREGIVTGHGDIYYTDPTDPDTDDDGLEDGHEAGERIDDVTVDEYLNLSDSNNITDSFSGEYYIPYSHPTAVDIDSDTLSDEDELNLGTSPFVKDTDGDGIPDAADSQPTTPLPTDDDLSTQQNARALMDGALFGQLGVRGGWAHRAVGERAESPYYLVGWIGFTFVPAVGAVADLRDALQAWASGQRFDAAISAAGVVPVIGDAAKGADVVLAWIQMYGKRPQVGRTLAKYILTFGHISNDIKWGIMEAVYGTVTSINKNYGVTTNALITLISEGIDVNRIKKLLGGKYVMWSRGPNGSEHARANNLERHYRAYAPEFGTDSDGNPVLTKTEYLRKAQHLMEKQQNVHLYYDMRRDELVVYDPKTNEVVFGTYYPQDDANEITRFDKMPRGSEYFDDSYFIRLN